MGLTMIDGTAPHIVDPKIPGALDGIINLGVYLDEEKLETNRREIEDLFSQNSACYKDAFAYLAAAGTIQERADSIGKVNIGALKRKVY